MRKMHLLAIALIIFPLVWFTRNPLAPWAFAVNYTPGANGPQYRIWLPLVVIKPIFYVDGNVGSDAYPGSRTQPWKTIQKAANTLAAGDTVLVAAGDYSSQRISITKSGNNTSPITYQAQGQVVMKGFNIVANYINIVGFEIANTDYRRWDYHTSAGIYVKGSYNLLENNYIHDSSLEGIELFGPPGDNMITHDNIVRYNRLFRNELVGIDVNGRNNLIEGNEVWRTVQCHPNLTRIEDHASDNNGKKCPYYPAISNLDADGIRFFGQGHIFRKNNIHDIVLGDIMNGINVNVTPHIDIFQTYAGPSNEIAQNIIFEQNYCENLNVGMYVFMLEGGANHLYIRNNIFKAAGGVNTAGGADYLYVFNNIWANDLALGSQGQSGAISLNKVPHASVINNIFFDQVGYTVQVLKNTANIYVDYNLAYNSNGIKPPCVEWGDYDTCQPTPNHELWNVNPQFINPDLGNYHLYATSPAINAGYDLGSLVPNDLDGFDRPQGPGYDIGAYEYP
ncbi:MAG TPA: choice-of-anchor Q domain-containing protein [Leptolinea sp.]